MSETLPVAENRPEYRTDEPPLSPADKAWWQQMGAVWPEQEQEIAWLEEMNDLVELGSRDLQEAAEGSEYSEILAAREEFLGRLTVARPDIVERLRGSIHYLVQPSTTIGTLRLFHGRGINVFNTFAQHPSYLSLSKEASGEHLDNLDALGIDSAQAVNKSPAIVGIAMATVHGRLQPMYAAARAFGWPDYKAQVIRLVNETPTILTYKTDKTRLLAQIAARSFDGKVPEDIKSGKIRSLYWDNPEDSIMAYMHYGSVIRSIDGLLFHARRCQHNWDRQAVQGEILRFADNSEDFRNDPVFKIYMRAYSPDPEVAERAWQRHVNARERRERDRDLLFERDGPMLLGDTALSALAAYRAVINSPKIPEERRVALDQDIIAGLYAKLQLELMHPAALDPEKQQDLTESVAAGEQARRVLVLRHLRLAVRIAREHNRSPQILEENTAIANVGLVRAGMEYTPEEGTDFEAFATRIIEEELCVRPSVNGRRSQTARGAK